MKKIKEALPSQPLFLKEGLRIDFRTPKGEPLNYIRFECSNCKDDTPTFIGAISKTEKAKLKKLKAAIDVLLGS